MTERPESLELVAELRSLDKRELSRILSVLSPLEQAQVLQLLEPANSQASFEALAGISPWLWQRIEAARNAGQGADCPGMTNAAREGLLHVFEEVSRRRAANSTAPQQKSGKSLIERFIRRPAKGAGA